MRLVMMGTGTFAEPTFQALLGSTHQVVGLVTQPDRPVGHERGSTRQAKQSIKALGEEQGVPVYQPESINTPEGIRHITDWQAELLVVAAYGQILSKEVLAAATHGGINVHGSLLPKYRGAAPVAWAIYHGEKQTGVTIIHMNPRLDAGDMLARGEVDISPNETAGEVEARLAVLGSKLAIEVVNQIAAGTQQAIPQDGTLVSKAPKLKKHHGIIDWSRDSWQVCSQIRAMQPWPTAYTFLHRPGKQPMRVMVNQAAVVESMEVAGWEAPMGTVFNPTLSELKLIVWAGHSTRLEIHELQPAGKRRMQAAEFLRGHPLRAGDRFGPESE